KGVSIEELSKRLVMSVEELADLTGCGRNNAYAAVKFGVYPSLRQGKTIKVLVQPTLAILRGERPPGTPTEAPKRHRPTEPQAEAAALTPDVKAAALSELPPDTHQVNTSQAWRPRTR